MDVTIVIATLDRVADLCITLEGWRRGTLLPAEVRVVDASSDDKTSQLCAEDWDPLQVVYIPSAVKSAAQQRNLGAEGCATELILFCDDDIELLPETLERLVAVFEQDGAEQIGGVAAAIKGSFHYPPRRLLRWYFQILAGYNHKTFGGKFFGPAINLFHTNLPDDPSLYPSEWLNSGLVIYRTRLFMQERFPHFTGYSFQEDVHLSVHIARTHNLYFLRDLTYIHKGSGGSHKADHFRIAMMQVANRWYNATELLQLRGFERAWKFALSQVMSTIWLLRSRPVGWFQRIVGGWHAWWRLAVLRHDVSQIMEFSAKVS